MGEISETLLNNPVRDTTLLPVEVSSTSKGKTIGRNKSGCLWKKGNSKRANVSDVSLARKTWEQKKESRINRKNL